MLLAIVLASTVPAPNAVSLSGSGGLVLSIEEGTEGNYLSGAYLVGSRLQYDRAVGHGWSVGAVGGYERVWQPERSNWAPPDADVLLVGAAAAGRWGKSVRGGLRFAAGFAYGMANLRYYISEPAPSLAPPRAYDRMTYSPGWFFDIEGEISAPLEGGWELFLDVPIVLSRTFYYPDAQPRETWWYAVPIIPFMATAGVRRMF